MKLVGKSFFNNLIREVFEKYLVKVSMDFSNNLKMAKNFEKNKKLLLVFAPVTLALLQLGCSQSDRAPRIGTVSAISGCASIIINEYSRSVTEASGIKAQEMTIEFYNDSSCAVDIQEYILKVGNNIFPFSSLLLKPREYNVVTLSLGSLGLNLENFDRIELVYKKNSAVSASAVVARASGGFQHAGRSPDLIGDFALLDRASGSMGRPNVNLGRVLKLSDQAGFAPRDSSPNAILRFNDAYWIFGGWGNYGHDVWYSVAEVWTSLDGVNWRLVNSNPPFNQYSSFFVFKGRMWALGAQSYSSIDGVLWRREALEFAHIKRAVVFDDAIFGFVGGRVIISRDGLTWQTGVDHAPWGEFRKEPVVLIHNDSIWLLGGTDEMESGEIISFKSDVWRSSDGMFWTRVISNAPWGERRWFNAISYDGWIWVMNGWHPDRWTEECGNTADIWRSIDGIAWEHLMPERIWGARHASYVVVSKDGGFLLLAGYGHCGVDRLYADVWAVK